MSDKRIKKFLDHFSDIIPLNLYIKITNQHLLLPFYHNISNTEPVHTKYLFKTKNEKQFNDDLDYLLKHYKPVDIDHLKGLTGNTLRTGQNCFWLSFDDGLSDVYHIAAPVLLKKGIPFGIFINTGFIDNKDLFYRYKASITIEKITKSTLTVTTLHEIEKLLKNEKLFKKSIVRSILSLRYFNMHIIDSIAGIINVDFSEYLVKNKPYLTSIQISDLAKQGVTIGSHSIDHPCFRDISIKEQLRQTKESIDFISSNFYPGTRIFSFPFNDVKVRKEYFNIVNKDGVIELSFGSSGLKHEKFPNHFHRISMENPEIPARKLLSSEYLYYLLKIPSGKNKIKRK